jgi:hypothetical protein
LPGFTAKNGSNFHAYIEAFPVGTPIAAAPTLPMQTESEAITEKIVQPEKINLPEKPETMPEKTVLLTNYPNPFNPETWIPYWLAEDANVTLTIYNTKGQLIRTISLGHQAAGRYESKSQAIYWDGRNDLGERVVSGVYFYRLTAGDYTATRKLLILK